MVAPEIVTERLRINDLRRSDAPALYGYRSHVDVAVFQGWVHHDSWYQLAVRLRSTDQLIGDLGLHFVGSDGQQAELGFSIAPAHQRRGLGSEAVSAVLGLLFTDLSKHRVFASVDPRNQASVALLRKVGLRQEANFRQSLLWRGTWVDDVVFAVLRSEWTGSRGVPE